MRIELPGVVKELPSGPAAAKALQKVQRDVSVRSALTRGLQSRMVPNSLRLCSASQAPRRRYWEVPWRCLTTWSADRQAIR